MEYIDWLDPEKSKIQFYLSSPQLPYMEFSMDNWKISLEDKDRIIFTPNKKIVSEAQIIFKKFIVFTKISNISKDYIEKLEILNDPSKRSNLITMKDSSFK